MNEHLRSYLEDSLQQIIRREKRLKKYKDQAVKSRERVIDQKLLYDRMKKEGVGATDLEHVKEREVKDQNNFEMFTRQIEEDEKFLTDFTDELIFNTKELSVDEIKTGGFFTHSIGLYEDATFNSKTENYELTKDTSHIKVITPVYATQWRDFSKLTIRKSETKKKGV